MAGEPSKKSAHSLRRPIPAGGGRLERDTGNLANPASQRVLDGYTVAFIGVGGLSKLDYYRAARVWGLKIIIFQSPMDSVPQDCADRVYTVANLFEHHRDSELAAEIAARLLASDVRPDGVLTLWEDCGPLAALVAQALGLVGVSPPAALIAKSKFLTQSVLREATSDDEKLGVPCFRCGSIEELDNAVAEIGLPALLKLEYGSSAVGVVPVCTIEEARSMWTRIRESLRTEADHPGVGLGFGPSIVATKLLTGTEHDVDLVIYHGELIVAFVTDNGPTRLPRFSEATAWMPTLAPQSQQSALVQAALEACRRIGLDHGTFNVEIIQSPEALRIIDVNARMGGFYIRDWIRAVWRYDILLASVLCALDIRPPSSGLPSGAVVGAMLLPSVHGTWLSESRTHRRLVELAASVQGIFNVFSQEASYSAFEDDPWGSIGLMRASFSEAREALLAFWRTAGLNEIDPGLWKHLPGNRQDAT